MDILRVQNLGVSFQGRKILGNINFFIKEREVFSLVGASGSGKTMLCMALLGIVPYPGTVEGEIIFLGRNLISLNKEEMRQVRGNQVSMVFQEPFMSLNPVLKVYEQISEAVTSHARIDKRAVFAKVKSLLNAVFLDQSVMYAYPHNLSGGMRQRVMIAIALACSPKLLILDEATTALDAMIQRQIIDLVLGIRDKFNLTILMVTHDFSLVNEIADRVAVMKDGAIVEHGDKKEVILRAKSSYTRKLINAIPKFNDNRKRLIKDGV